MIELLVVVAIIAMLISILLPSLSAAREQAKAVVCGQQLRQLATGLGTYTAENSDWIPGLNTSGVAVRALVLEPDAGAYAQSKLPVQDFDWMTPVLTGSTEMPSRRADRFKFLLEKYKCPSQRYTAIPWQGSGGPDKPEIDALAPWPAASYKMPIHFQYVGRRDVTTLAFAQRAHYNVAIDAIPGPTSWEVDVQNYLPMMTRVGSPAQKVFAADGTRYLDDDQTLDFDTTPSPPDHYFGAFTCASPWWSGSVAWGVKGQTKNWNGANVSRGSLSGGQNLVLSYRHGRQRGVLSGDCHDNNGMMNAAFFDGHVSRLTDRQSREAEMWYPKGSVVTPSGAAEGMTSRPDGFVIP